MNTKKLIIAGLAALAFGAISSSAQTIAGNPISGGNAGAPGDLILGFQNSSNSNDLVFDIGAFSSYEGLAPGTYTVGGFTSADLTGTFGTGGTGGYSSSTQWTVFGGSGAGNGLSVPDATLWATSTGPAFRSNTNQANLSQTIDGWVENHVPFDLSTAGLTSGGTISNTNANSMTKTVSPQNSMGGFFSSAVETSAAGTSSLLLYELLPTTSLSGAPGTLLGTFTLNSTTDLLTFTVIPEPSTYAAILGVVTLGIVAIRRRKQTQVAV